MGMKPDIIEDVDRYALWFCPAFPIGLPMRRPRERALPWRQNLLESVRKEGLRYPVLVYGHSPKGSFNMARWGHAQEGRDERMYIAFGTNRYYCLEKLGADTFPAILSWNKGDTPPPETSAEFVISPWEFREYAPPGRVIVQRHGFGWQLAQIPEDEFACPIAATG